MTAVGGFPSSSAAVEAVLDRYGVADAGQRQRVVREAERRLRERATRHVVRVLMHEALGQGWRHPSSSDVVEVPSDFPVPIQQDVYCRVVRWVSEAPGEFSVRDLQRASNFFESAADARAVLSGLVALGEVEVVEGPLRWGGERGRIPGTRYRAVRRPAAGAAVPEPRVIREAADDELDWSAVLRFDEI